MTHWNIPGEYLPCEIPPIGHGPDIDAFDAFLQTARQSAGLSSVVISAPYKQLAFERVDTRDQVAQCTGAVNLIENRDGMLHGLNLDGFAFIRSLEFEQPSVSVENAAFFGCGGVTTSVAVALKDRLSTVRLFDIEAERAAALRTRLLALNPTIEVCTPAMDDLTSCNFLYNGTGLGKTSSDPNSVSLSPLPAGARLPSSGLAVDANYRPPETMFLAECRKHGMRTMNGYHHMIGFVSLHLSRLAGKPIGITDILRSLATVS